MNRFTSCFFVLCTFAPATVFAADGHYSVSNFIWRVAMFAIFLVILYKLLAKRVVNALDSGVQNIVNNLEEAENALANSEKELEDYSNKIAGMNDELDKMKANALITAKKESEIMVADAERSAAKVMEFTASVIKTETDKAKKDLHNELILLAVAEAEQRLAEEKDIDKKKKFISNVIPDIEVRQ